ncbi:MAG: hypothetical protein A2V70_16705 [Planctomycetes bacterium RBG_13_63_9]|nr:MAG: hypothetical protein A2V70_16705 [Planctomycetes bacterium RBG_13_63_9]
MEQQQSLLEQERRMLESELETVRNRAAEMAESLADQKRLSAQQQSQWADELKRMRRLLESMSVRLAEAEIAQSNARSEPRGPASGGSDGHVASEEDDAALDSVVAQFEILQKDLARRRAARV